MELTEKLRSTLENTYSLALKLEEVSSMIIPRKIGERARKRLLNINRELRSFCVTDKKKDKISDIFKKPIKKNSSTPKEKGLDSTFTSSQVKRNLSISIKEVNQRVKLSRAGKHSVAKCMSLRRSGKQFPNSSILSDSTRYPFLTDSFEEKPQPYVSLTSGKIEDPITLPTFDEFLVSKGEDFNQLKGKDELFYRIDKATEQITRFKESLQSKNFGKNFDDKRKITVQPTRFIKNDYELLDSGKKNELKALMNQYFHMPCIYDSPRTKRNSVCFTANDRSVALSSEAEEALENTLKNFNRTKAVENRKILDILDKLKLDRPLVLRKKIQLIQGDTEKYKNKHHSIEKFNFFREQIEKAKREDQFKIYQQGLVYLEILDEFKRHRHKPSNSELVILGFWKKVVESGCIITQNEFHEVISIIAPNDVDNKEVQVLLDKFYSSINV